MRFLVMVKATGNSEAGVLPDAQLIKDMGAYNDELIKAGVLIAAEGLHPSSKGVRVRFQGPQRTVIDGPFAETKELVAGFWLWELPSMKEAIEWIKRCPNPTDEVGEIEIRQVQDESDWPQELRDAAPEVFEQEREIRAKTGKPKR
jgi:hypothetical protein